jgi:hypothetical protein
MVKEMIVTQLMVCIAMGKDSTTLYHDLPEELY